MKKSELIDLAKPLYEADQLAELAEAIDYAAQAHRGQKRASGEPYLTHPLSVAGILADWTMDIDTVIAGVLHDTVEDTATTLTEIENFFGRDVAFLVDGVTKVTEARAGMRNLDGYLPATKDNLTKLMIAVGEDVRVIIIKLADRLHNMQTLKHLHADKQRKIALETIEVFAPLADRLNMGRVRVQLEELSFSYLEPKTYKRLKKLMKERLGKSHRKLATVRHHIDQELTGHDIAHKIDGRIKSVYSLHKKLQKVGDINQIYDLIALRVIVDNVTDCYQALGVIHGLYQPLPNRIKDYIAMPKSNGYQSLHTTVQTPEEHIVELQIRTEQMHDYAERGLAASFHYNEQKLTDAYKKGRIAPMPAALSWIQELQQVAAKLNAGETASIDHLKLDLFTDRIFVYSPKGDIYDLPRGAFPLDYAYRVHSDVAMHAFGFKVNDKMIKFDDRLNDGDTVEIITKRSAKPNPDWLKWISTGHAREKLRAQLRKDGIRT